MHTDEDFLSESAKKLKRHQPSDELWKKIETQLSEEKMQQKKSDRFKIIFKPVWGFLSGETITSKLAFASVFVAVAIGFFVLVKMKEPAKNVADEAKIDQTLQNARMDYQRSISELEHYVEKNKDQIDARYYAIKKEKISFLDESIKECEKALSENELNVKIQQFLKQSLDEKLSTLKDLVNSAKENKKNEKS